ncbi:hypothetical protein [Paraburkholderia sp. J7]|uniref:hypothetical protein n=1 Tax=Paraburkholderia sp. J7 TaxID=2805438 RepID=UPI002AB6D5AA|nr:hypothetical protein [Paraburkholderia sp. J7]
MKSAIRATAIAAAIALTGCATEPTPRTSSTSAPSERVTAYQTAAPGIDTGTLIVTRDSGFIGGGCFYAVSINGKLAARLDTGESSRFIVPAGEVLLRAGRDPQGKGLCSIGKSEWTQRETTLKPGETKLFRLSLDMNGKADIQRADDE